MRHSSLQNCRDLPRSPGGSGLPHPARLHCPPSPAGTLPFAGITAVVRSFLVWPLFMLLTCPLASCPETSHPLFVSTHVTNSWIAARPPRRSPRYRPRRPADWPVLVRSGHLLGHIREKWPGHLRPDSGGGGVRRFAHEPHPIIIISLSK